MSDIALTWSRADAAMAMAVVDDDVAVDAGLRTSVLLSLFVDRRAAEEDVLIDPEDRRGWWGDEFAEAEGDLEGSRLWQLERALLTSDLPARSEAYDREALGWMIEDRVAGTLDIVVETEGQGLVTNITINRPGEEAINFRFASAWEAEDAISAG